MTAPIHQLMKLLSITVPVVSLDGTQPTLPSFLASSTKVVLAKDGIYHKGYILHNTFGMFLFSVSHHLFSKCEEWGVDLPALSSKWPTLFAENKSHIVFLGNFEDPTWDKHEQAALVLKFSSLCLMGSAAIEHQCKLKQVDYKNAFCNPTLPTNVTTIICPPLGDPNAQPGEYLLLNKTLYGLWHSPKHWYDMASAALLEMGLTQSIHDLCLFHGIPSTSGIPSTFDNEEPFTVGLYIDDLVYYSISDEVEQRCEQILASKFKISFMGVVNWFLGTHFTWSDTQDGNISDIGQ